MGGLVMTDPSTITAALGLGEPWSYLALPGRAALLGGPLFRFIFLFFMDFLKINFFFYISYWLPFLLIVCGDVESYWVQVLTSVFRSSIPTFVVFMPIWESWLWLDLIMMFWFVLSLKSLIAAVSQSSLFLVLVAPTEAAELHSWCPGYGSLC